MKHSRLVLASLVAVAALSGCGSDSGPTQPFNTLDTTPPPAPTNVVVTGSAGNRQLAWDASAASDLAGYEVWGAVSGTGSFTLVGYVGGDRASFTVPPVDQAASMDFRVRSYDVTGNRSAYSSSISTEVVSPSTGSPESPRMGHIAP